MVLLLKIHSILTQTNRKVSANTHYSHLLSWPWTLSDPLFQFFLGGTLPLICEPLAFKPGAATLDHNLVQKKKEEAFELYIWISGSLHSYCSSFKSCGPNQHSSSESCITCACFPILVGQSTLWLELQLLLILLLPCLLIKQLRKLQPTLKLDETIAGRLKDWNQLCIKLYYKKSSKIITYKYLYRGHWNVCKKKWLMGCRTSFQNVWS